MIICESCFNKYDEKYNICPYCGHYEGEMEQPQYRLSYGTILNNRYKVGKTLGVGGFGITYMAWDTELQRVVAIKEYYYADIVSRAPGTKDVVLAAESYKDIYKSGRDRLLDEAKYVSKIQNKKNIVEVFGYFEENNTAYMVMEYIDGMLLKDIIIENGKLSVEDAVNIISGVCIALKISHKNKILHRDVAPDNIMITADLKTDDSIKLIDFGAAKFQNGEEPIDRVIKHGFAPPEQYEGDSRQGEWTDVYGLGATLYYALTGIKPQDAQKRKEKDSLISPYEVDENIPENVSNAVMRAMALEIHERFSDIDTFRKAIIGKKKVYNLKKYRKIKNRRRIISIVAAILIVVMGGILFGKNYIKQKESVTLKSATISLWIQGNDQDKENAMREASEAFMQAYGNVKINVVSVPNEEYENKLSEALNNNTMPEIFETTENISEYRDKIQDVSLIVKGTKDNVWFYDELFEKAKNRKTVVLGFEMPVFYLNTTKYEGNASNYKDVAQKLGTSGMKECLDKDKFLSGKSVGYSGTSSDYSDIQKALPAQYKMLQMPGALNCVSKYEFAMLDCKGNEEKAAAKFLEYMYSDRAEDIIFVQNNVSALPANKKALELYEHVYTEYKGFFYEIDSYKLSK